MKNIVGFSKKNTFEVISVKESKEKIRKEPLKKIFGKFRERFYARIPAKKKHL